MCQFRLRWRSALVKNSRGMEQYDWLRNGFFTKHGLHNHQDFSGGRLQAWMEEMTWLPTWQHFLLGESFEGQVSWATSNPYKKTWHPENSNLIFWVWSIVFPACPPYRLLPEIALSWGWNSWPTGALLHCSANGIVNVPPIQGATLGR